MEAQDFARLAAADVCLAWQPKCEKEVCSYDDPELKDCAVKVPADHDIHFVRLRLIDDPFLCIHQSDGTNSQLRGSDTLLTSLGLCNMEDMEKTIRDNEAFVFSRIPEHPSNPGNMCHSGMMPIAGTNTNMIKCVTRVEAQEQ